MGGERGEGGFGGGEALFRLLRGGAACGGVGGVFLLFGGWGGAHGDVDDDYGMFDALSDVYVCKLYLMPVLLF